MLSPLTDDRSSGRPSLFPTVLTYLTAGRLWRLLMAFLMTTTFVIGAWSFMVPQALAAQTASRGSITPLSTLHPASTAPRRNLIANTTVSACPALTGTPNVNGTVDGLGNVGFYTFVPQKLDDRLQLRTNVANGNLVMQDTAMNLVGTGLNLLIQATYNAQSSASGTLGSNWNLSVGDGVSLSIGDDSITLHGSSGYAAPYTVDGNSYGGYDEPAGLDATLLKSSVNGATYVLIFQKSSECFGFNASGQEIFDQDKNGHHITFAYNGSGHLESITDTQNRLTTIGYDAKGRVNLITDPINRTVQFHYTDSNNNLNSIVDMDGNTTSFVYSGHDVTTITDPRGKTTTLSYLTGDVVGSITDATNATTSFDYDSSSESDCTGIAQLPCTEVTDANTHVTTYSYSGLEVMHVRDASGNTVSNQYSPDANISQYTDELGNTTVFGFDSGPGKSNNLLSVTDGNTAKTTLGYGGSGSSDPYFPTQTTDPNSFGTSYGYDNYGNLTNAADNTNNGTGDSVSYTYNTGGTFGSYTFGLLLSAEDGNDHTTHYGYDQYGNLKTITPPSQIGPTTIAVDGASRVTSVTDGKGQVTLFTYDNLDRITEIQYNNGNGGSITYTYDKNGNLLTVVDNTGTTTFTYDNDNRILTKTLPSSEILKTTYDPVGNLASYKDSGGKVSYSYRDNNQIETITDPNGAQSSFTYNGTQRHTLTYPNGVVLTYGYDNANHITSEVAKNSGGTTLINMQYGYTNPNTGAISNLLQTMTYLDPIYPQEGSYEWGYTYDSMSRLHEATLTSTSTHVQVDEVEYQYDHAGNRTSYTESNISANVSYSYNAANELTTQTPSGGSPINYTYDLNGNLTSVSGSGGASYTYNAKNQTTAIGSTTFDYTGATQTERTQETNSNGTVNFVNSGLGLSSKANTSGSIYYTRCSCGQLIGDREPGGSKYYYLLDAQDSVVATTDSSGNLVDGYVYEPFGTLLESNVTHANPWGFQSGFYDGSTGLYKFGARYYDPTVGRWTQQDPIAGSLFSANGLNRYTFVGDDPVNQVDPSGASGVFGVFQNCYFSSTVGEFGNFLLIGVGVAATVCSVFCQPALPFIGGLAVGLFVSITVFCIGYTIGTFFPGI